MKKKKLGKLIGRKLGNVTPEFHNYLDVVDTKLLMKIEQMLFVDLDLGLVLGLAEEIKNVLERNRVCEQKS